MEPEGSLPHSQQPAICPCPQRDQSNLCSSSHFLKTHFNITLPSALSFSKWSRSFKLTTKTLYAPHFPHTCHLPRPSHSSWFNHSNNNLWAVITYHDVPRCAAFSIILLLRPSQENFFSIPLSSTLNLCFSVNVKDQVSHPQNTGRIILLYAKILRLVEALRYEPEGRGFDSLWCHCDFSLI